MILKAFSSNESMVDAKSKSKENSEAASVPSTVKPDTSSTTQESASSRSSSEPAPRKPFFLMDWLNQVDAQAMELAQKVLRTPQKIPTNAAAQQAKDTSSLSPVRKNLNASSATSPFLKRSVAIGNGYNAKGIQKARLGEWEDALACWENALEIRLQLGNDLDVANTYNNIGIALGKLDRPQEAIEALQNALTIRQDHAERSEVAATLHNLGNVYQLEGDLHSAIQYFCECKILQEDIHGTANHVEVARACVAIGHTYFQAEALTDAGEAYMDALHIFENIRYSDDHPEVQATLQDVHDLEAKIASL